MRPILAKRKVLLAILAAGFVGCAPKGMQSRNAAAIEMRRNEIRGSEFDRLQELARDNGLDFKKIIDERVKINQGHVIALDLSCTQVSDIRALSGLMNLEELVLDFTRITDIRSLRGSSKLKALTLSYTEVSDITVLGELRGLTYLLLSKTPVSDISALSNLRNLRVLGLGYTRVRDLSPLRGLSRLRNLDLEGLPFSQGEKAALSSRMGDLHFEPFLTLPEDSCSMPR